MGSVKKIWVGSQNALFLGSPSRDQELLENSVYTVGLSQKGFFLSKVADDFTFDYKIYGLEKEFINRVVKTYEVTDSGNLGVLLNGLKGTGKTVTAKMICNKLNQPVILVNKIGDGSENILHGVANFLNMISQNITIFVDEYEKVFAKSHAMLTIMDGALNSDYRRVFLLTTNDLHVERNLLNRPSRVRYLSTFDNLNPDVIEEIVDDLLKYPERKMECITFISTLESITVDIVKEILSEVNIHNETPDNFASIFNVSKLEGAYNVMIKIGDVFQPLANGIRFEPSPQFYDGLEGYSVCLENQLIGRVGKIINWTTIEVKPILGPNDQSLGFQEPIVIKVEKAPSVNNTYAYGGYTVGGATPTKGLTKIGVELVDKIKSDKGKSSNVDEVEIFLPSSSDSYSIDSEF